MPVHDVDGALTAWTNGEEALNSTAAALAGSRGNYDVNGGFVMPPTASDR